MITTIALANISMTSHNYHILFVVKTLQIQSFSNYVCNTVLLAIITTPCLRAPELLPTPPPGKCHATLCFYVWLFSIPHIYRTVTVFLWFTSLSIMPSWKATDFLTGFSTSERGIYLGLYTRLIYAPGIALKWSIYYVSWNLWPRLI